MRVTATHISPSSSPVGMPESDLPETDWTALIARAIDGNDGAASRIVSELHGHVLRIVRNHLPRHADEQDLVQEIFMKVFASMDRFRGEQPFPHWVARISVNTCYDHLRKQKHRTEIRFADLSSEECAFVDALLADQTTPVHSQDLDGRSLVEKLLATLKPQEQWLLKLLDLEKRPVREVCDLTGWGASKVKVTAMRARRKLNDHLRKLEPHIHS